MALSEIRARVDRLGSLDPDRRRFGAAQHGYQLQPPWSEAALADFERRNAVELPAEYRKFVLQVASAGAGPGYGLLPPTAIELDAFPRVVTRVQSNDGRITSEAGTPWRPPFAGRSSAGRAFPLRDAFEPLMVYDLPAIPEDAAPYDGCLQLCDNGCGYFDFLIVGGPFAGQVWSDTMAAMRDGAMAPTGAGFLAWYQHWLEQEEKELAKAKAAPADDDPVVFPGAGVARLSDYVKIVRRMQGGDLMGALAAYGLDVMSWGKVAGSWAAKMAANPALTARFAKMMAS